MACYHDLIFVYHAAACIFFCFFINFSLAVAESAFESSKNEFSNTNFVVMMADDLGYGDLSYNGGPVDTPNLDAMAYSKHSVVFDKFYTGSSVCSPTRASVLTGRTPWKDCVDYSNIFTSINALSTGTRTIAEVLKEHTNYKTALFGKWHLGNLASMPSVERARVIHPGLHGFDHFVSTKQSVSTYYPSCMCHKHKKDCKLQTGPSSNAKARHSCAEFKTEKYSNNFSGPVFGQSPELNTLDTYEVYDTAGFLVDKFEEFVEQTNGTGFLSFIWFHAPHKPFVASPEWVQKCLNGEICDLDRLKEHAAKVGDNNLEKLAHYYGSIVLMDQQVGRVRNILQKHSIKNNTQLYFFSDNGAIHVGSNGNLRGNKYAFFEGGIRVPGIVEWPNGIAFNRVVTNFAASTVDVFPTIIDTLGLDVEVPPEGSKVFAPQLDGGGLDGISLFGLLRLGSSKTGVPVDDMITLGRRTLGWYDAKIVKSDELSFDKVVIVYKNYKYKHFNLYDLAGEGGEWTPLVVGQAPGIPLIKNDYDPALVNIYDMVKAKAKKWAKSVESSRRFGFTCKEEAWLNWAPEAEGLLKFYDRFLKCKGKKLSQQKCTSIDIGSDGNISCVYTRKQCTYEVPTNPVDFCTRFLTEDGCQRARPFPQSKSSIFCYWNTKKKKCVFHEFSTPLPPTRSPTSNKQNNSHPSCAELEKKKHCRADPECKWFKKKGCLFVTQSPTVAPVVSKPPHENQDSCHGFSKRLCRKSTKTCHWTKHKGCFNKS